MTQKTNKPSYYTQEEIDKMRDDLARKVLGLKTGVDNGEAFYAMPDREDSIYILEHNWQPFYDNPHSRDSNQWHLILRKLTQLGVEATIKSEIIEGNREYSVKFKKGHDSSMSSASTLSAAICLAALGIIDE